MLVLMLQKEVAERLTAPPGTKAYGILTVLLSLHFQIRIRQKVSRHCFSPVPGVDSAVIQCRPRMGEPVDPVQERIFRRVVKAAFSKRRKTLFNALRSSTDRLPVGEERLRAVLEELSIDPVRRPETLSPEEFHRLSRCILDASDAE
jgi:16S rRNA (adenine1518-N6/adenine1519-N6)-dimethyltransferase